MEKVTRIRKRKNLAIISSDEDQESKNDCYQNVQYADRNDMQECKKRLPRIKECRRQKKVKRIVTKFVDSSDEEGQEKTENSNIQKWKRNLENLCNKKRNKNKACQKEEQSDTSTESESEEA